MDYQDVNFSEKRLKFAHFLVAKKKLFKKLSIILLIFFNIFLFSFSIYHFILYFSQSKEHELMLRELATNVVNYSSLRPAISPLPLDVVGTRAVFTGSQRYNLICQVVNPNFSWFVKSVDYRFVGAGFESDYSTTFVLPGEEKFLVSFNETFDRLPLDIFCEFKELKWQRIRPDRYHLLEIKENFLIKELENTPPIDIRARSVTNFKFVNENIYNFWEIGLLVVLYEGNRIVAVERTKIEEILSGQEREVKIIWPIAVPFISRTEVQVEVDVFESSLFFIPRFEPESRPTRQ